MAGDGNRESQTGNAKEDGRNQKRKRNLFGKNAERIRNRISPKRRAGTPEPEQRAFAEDSEKKTSEAEDLARSTGSLGSAGSEAGTGGRQGSGRRRFAIRMERCGDRRSKSLEGIPAARETEAEDDFELIKRMHRSKELEEEKKESEKPKPRGKEEPKDFVPKEMPPLIMAPKNSKRKRHKSLPLVEYYGDEDEIPKSLRVKPKTKPAARRKPTNFEIEEMVRLRRSCGGKPESPPSSADTPEVELDETTTEKKPGLFKRWFSSRGKKPEKENLESMEKPKAEGKAEKRWLVVEILHEWNCHVRENETYYEGCKKLKNRCVTDLFLLLFFCGCGGLVFRFVEGTFESFYKCGVKRVKRDFTDALWKYSQYLREEEWKSQARRRLMEFENQLHTAHEAGVTTYSGQRSWSFLNAVVYCLTVVTTIGYGHISPSTTTGRAITIIYAIFGIPMFLILLADFGKLFTRGIKFVWAFVRRLYYTGSCRRVRKTAPVQEMMKGMQIMYDFAKTRKFSTTSEMEGQTNHQLNPTELSGQSHHLKPPETNIQGIPETPGTPNWSNFEIDDEFNLPISVAISILLTYIFFGAFLYWMWEDWSFFESFYFVFISMSTIGFGDFVPQHPIYMMLSIVYLVFGLALTSMCINVVQEKLSDTFRKASAKLGTTIGLSVDEPVIISEGDQSEKVEDTRAKS